MWWAVVHPRSNASGFREEPRSRFRDLRGHHNEREGTRHPAADADEAHAAVEQRRPKQLRIEKLEASKKRMRITK
jgi:hypothetical protein